MRRVTQTARNQIRAFILVTVDTGALGHKAQIVSYKGGFISEADVLHPQRTAFNEEDVLLEDRRGRGRKTLLSARSGQT